MYIYTYIWMQCMCVREVQELQEMRAHTYIHCCIPCKTSPLYGVALVSRIDKMIGLFCKRALQKRRYSAKETCHFIDPTDRSHPICLASLYLSHLLQEMRGDIHSCISSFSLSLASLARTTRVWDIDSCISCLSLSLASLCLLHVFSCKKLIARKPPPRGGFLYTMFPNQESEARGPPSKNLYQVLRGGSSSSGFLIREHSK